MHWHRQSVYISTDFTADKQEKSIQTGLNICLVRERLPAKLIRQGGRLVPTSSRPLSRQGVNQVLEEFP